MTEGVASRSGWDLVLGGLLVVAAVVLMTHAVVATVLSILTIGWLAFAIGLMTVFVSLFRLGKAGFWSGLLGGGLIAALGFVMLRNPDAAAVTLTLVAGAVFLTTGIARLAAATQVPEARGALLIAGGASTLLGLLVLFNLVDASYSLLGILLGVQVLFEGTAIMVAGRSATRLTAPGAEPAPAT